jgi:uncharacterized protein YdiU (UPF0061 family)
MPMNDARRWLSEPSLTDLGLPSEFYERLAPTPVRSPRLLMWNERLASELQLELRDADEKAQVFAGNWTPPGFEPIALAYAGHQFGHFVPSLGDGRAHLLGEVIDREGRGQELQLKGSGRTRFSRGGDGRCAMGPAIREFLMSEAMFGLRVPTSRSLCVVATGETVLREEPQPGAIVTRVARSHLRVGTFQYFAARKNTSAVRTLVDYAIERLFPDVDAAPGPERALAFFERVVTAQIATVTDWMRVGFIHGVMNTDNTSISGETIDFGPCAMMNAFDPATVFSSIDRRGRYAYGNQPNIIVWNMVRLAECLLPLLHKDSEKAVESIQPRIDEVPDRLESAQRSMLGEKTGFARVTPEDLALLADLLKLMEEHALDYTNTFTALTDFLDGAIEGSAPPEPLAPWIPRWHARLDHVTSRAEANRLMQRANPVVIPRNHHVEAALAAVAEHGDTGPAESLLAVLRDPYHRGPESAAYTDPPPGGDQGYQTFCGT